MTSAILASLLPTDTSALERAISALENSISALESSIATLDGSLVFWELLGFASAGLVVIGVLLELHDILHRHDEEKVAWALSFFGVVRSLERPRFWKKYRVELASVILVAGGVAGELSAGLMIESKNTALRAIDIQLRSKNSELRSNSDQLLALVTQQASNAETLASANDLEAQRLKAENLKLEALIQPRDLTSAQQKLIRNDLILFPRKLVTITAYAFDQESVRLGTLLEDVLKKSGIDAQFSPVPRFPFVNLPVGLRIEGPDNALVTSLQHALGVDGKLALTDPNWKPDLGLGVMVSPGVKVSIRGRTSASAQANIFVGPKPFPKN